jgi:hypothetical protein
VTVAALLRTEPAADRRTERHPTGASLSEASRPHADHGNEAVVEAVAGRGSAAEPEQYYAG